MSWKTMNHTILDTKEQAASYLAEALYQLFSSLNKKIITLAISGGTTPYILFEEWAKNYKDKIDWQKIHFFWVDERCVEPESPESNFGNTKTTLFDKVQIPLENIHRVRGEDDPQKEAERYAKEIEVWIPKVNGMPQFDVILLGMGDDGHTASIFPPFIELLNSERWVEATQNPYNRQNRITLTGKVINQAFYAYFLVTGKGKAPVVKQLFKRESEFEKYPAAHINLKSEHLTWILDQEAASELN